MRISDWSSDVCSSDLKRALDRPVAAIMDPRRHLVEDSAVRRGEEFHRQDTDIIERVGDFAGERLRFRDRRPKRGRRGDARMVQYAMGVDIFRRVPERRLARRRAAEQNGEFGIEADEAFEYARRALHRLRSEEHTSEIQSLMR